MTSPLSRGLFKRVIGESGSVVGLAAPLRSLKPKRMVKPSQRVGALPPAPR